MCCYKYILFRKPFASVNGQIITCTIIEKPFKTKKTDNHNITNCKSTIISEIKERFNLIWNETCFVLIELKNSRLKDAICMNNNVNF